MKTVFIVVSKDIMRRNIIDTGFWSTLRAGAHDARIVLVVEDGKKELFEQFGGQNVEVVEYARVPHEGLQKVLVFLVRTGLCSKSTTFHRWHAYTRGKAGLGMTLFKSFLANTVGRASWYKHLLRKLLQKTTQPKEVRQLFDTYKPDLIFALSLIDIDFDVLFSLEARKRGVRVAGMVRSWDNLSHHYLLPFVPDHFIFQNTWLKEAAETFQAVNVGKITNSIVGLPHYDSYFDPSPMIKDRTIFFESMGLDPEKSLLFIGGAEYYHSEDSLLALLDDAIEEGRIPGPIQVLYRRHPSSMYTVEDMHLDKLKHVVLDTGTAKTDGPKFNDTDQFVNTLYYSDVTMNISSTLAIDAATFGKPVIAIDYDDPKKNLSRWESVHRFNDYFDHQIRLNATGGVRVPHTADDVVNDVNKYLENPEKDAKGRKRLLEEFAEPFDGKAGERLGNLIAEEIEKV